MYAIRSYYAKVHQRGLVLGIFNSFGYFGTFLGGLLGGIFYEKTSLTSLVITISIVCILWIILILTMPNPTKKKTSYIHVDNVNNDSLHKLDNLTGIDEWYINETEKLVIVKYDSDVIV